MAKQVAAAQPEIDEPPAEEMPANDAGATAPEPVEAATGEAAADDSPPREGDQNIIELAIERALDDVRAEIEATSAEVLKEEQEKAERERKEAEAEEAKAKAPDTPPAEGKAEAVGDPAKDESAGETEGEPAAEAAEPSGKTEEATETPDAGAEASKDEPADDDSASGEPVAEDASVAASFGGLPLADVPFGKPGAEVPSAEGAGDTDAASPEGDESTEPLSHILARVTPPTSLEEIGQAVSAAGGRPMDQMVQDMMRPIVREWLANNLPSLVERVIREEIEKVSRSGV